MLAVQALNTGDCAYLHEDTLAIWLLNCDSKLAVSCSS